MKKLVPLVLLTIFSAVQMNAQHKQVFTKNNIAVNGYDVVAYFTDSNAIKGTEEHTVCWNDPKLLFATGDHVFLIKAIPEKYAPQYGGYCAYGTSRGYKAPTQPEAWSTVDGKLYLNYNLDVQKTWSADRANLIKKADVNWKKIEAE